MHLSVPQPITPTRQLSLLTDLAGCLAPLCRESRPGLDYVRFIGSESELFAFASDGHVVALVVALGDFRHIGDALLPGRVAARIGYREWDRRPYEEPEEALTAEAHLRAPEPDELSLAKVLRVMPPSRAPAASRGTFLGPALATLGRVVGRIGCGVQLAGGTDTEALRADSVAFTSETGDRMWLSCAVMPGLFPAPDGAL